ncbi:MAG: hypothetical protein FGM15_12715 [Chthoniobacterales bacterium]|nr:hypothetical protein [Chthoniobacterales bacterium]
MTYDMEEEDFIRLKDAEIAALREELASKNATIDRLEDEVAKLYRAAQTATREHLQMRQRLQALADEADKEIALAKAANEARRAEAEALEL